MRKAFLPILLSTFSVLVVVYFLALKKENSFLPSKLNSRTLAVNMIKSKCKTENYQEVALRSLRYLNKEYAIITQEDLNDTSILKAYLNKTENLCKLLLSDYELETTQNNNGTWTYRFRFPWGSMAYGLAYFENQWRFILPESAYL